MRFSLIWMVLSLLFLHVAWKRASCKELEGFGEDWEDDEVEDDEFITSVKDPLLKASSVVLEPEIDLQSNEIDSGSNVGSDREGGEKRYQIGETEGKSAAMKPDKPKERVTGDGKSKLKGDGLDAKVELDTKRKSIVRDEWDAEEFEGIPSYQADSHSSQRTDPVKEEVKKSPSNPLRRTPQASPPSKPFRPQDYIPEWCFIGFLAIYVINYFLGSSRNEQLALAWADQFVSEGSMFEKNFSLLGPGESNDDKEPLMIKEGQASFKFYASGRRYCECALVKLDLRARHDLVSLLWYLVFPKVDTVTVEVFMNEDSMEPFVLAVVPRKLAKGFLKENADLKEFGSIMDLSSKRKWPADRLAVIGDSREAANELLNDVILDNLLGDKAFSKHAEPFFISLHCTDQAPRPVKKKLLRFQFELPAAGKMTDLARLMAAVPFFIDAVGRLTLSAQAKSRAEAARAKAQQAAMREQHEQRMEEMQRRREERRRAEEARMNPAELAKRKEKERLKDIRPRARVARIH